MNRSNKSKAEQAKDRRVADLIAAHRAKNNPPVLHPVCQPGEFVKACSIIAKLEKEITAEFPPPAKRLTIAEQRQKRVDWATSVEFIR